MAIWLSEAVRTQLSESERLRVKGRLKVKERTRFRYVRIRV